MIQNAERQGQLAELQATLSYRFRNLSLLEEALTHTSFAHEQGRPGQNNERLEFLGDAVLSLLMSAYLFHTCPEEAEGTLSRLRAAMVQESMLAKIARHLRLGEYLLLGRGEEQSGGRDKSSLLANTLEAVIAAIYLDGGPVRTAEVVLSLFQSELQAVLRSYLQDPKSLLQQYTLERGEGLPRYRLISEEGPAHAKTFVVEILIANRVRGRGRGKSKKEAEQAAALSVLAEKGW
jgi:ribonuclease-3